MLRYKTRLILSLLILGEAAAASAATKEKPAKLHYAWIAAGC